MQTSSKFGVQSKNTFPVFLTTSTTTKQRDDNHIHTDTTINEK